MLQINKPKWDAWKMLPEAVRSGAVPFALAHGGLDMHQVRLYVEAADLMLVCDVDDVCTGEGNKGNCVREQEIQCSTLSPTGMSSICCT